MNTSHILLASFLSISLFGAEIHNSKFNFSFTIPDRFIDYPAGKNDPSILYSFARMDPGGKSHMLINIQAMGAKISSAPWPETLTESQKQAIPFGASYKRIQGTWHNYTVHGMENRYSLGNIPFLVRQLQIPLAPSAMMVMILGNPKDEFEISNLLQQVVSSINGSSNWD